MKSRLMLVFVGFGMFWSLLLVRVFLLQVFPHARLQRMEERQYETRVVVEGRRGSIYDRNGVELAISIPAYSLYGDPSLLTNDILNVSKKLSALFGGSTSTFLKLLKDNSKKFIWIRRQIPFEKMEEIKKWQVRGLGFIQEPLRVYPDEEILRSVLGVVGRSGLGLEGLEKEYDSILRSNSKKMQVRRDARGRPLQINGLLVSETEDGKDIHTTLDRELQYVLHRELKRTVQEYQAQGAMGVILDAETSEVRALDGVGHTMEGKSVEEAPYRNRPILESFEPGSTLKTFIVAAGLKEKKWLPNKKFYCENGEFKVGGRVIGEADLTHRFGWLTISEILALSSNVGVSKMALELGANAVRKTLEQFGFGRKTGIDLPGESRGILQAFPWRPHLLSNISFGHGMTATALQVANAYAAIANGGILKRPRITTEIIESQTGWPWLKFFGTNQLEQPNKVRVLSETEAQTLRLLLAGVVGGKGTGVSAKVEGYPVGGKTGTAQKVNPRGLGYLPGGYVSSFAGMIPANQPKFVIYVAVDSPQGSYYGSQVAAPLFSKIATYAVQHEGLPPQWLDEQKAQDLIGNNLLPKVAEAKSFDSKEALLPNSRELFTELGVQKKGNVELATSPTNAVHMIPMPPLEHLSLREVQARLTVPGLKVSVFGSGRVNRTEPEFGQPLHQNSEVKIWLSRE